MHIYLICPSIMCVLIRTSLIQKSQPELQFPTRNLSKVVDIPGYTFS